MPLSIVAGNSPKTVENCGYQNIVKLRVSSICALTPKVIREVEHEPLALATISATAATTETSAVASFIHSFQS
jgi:hypothetical protein